MKVYKSIITVTVLHSDVDNILLDTLSLADIVAEMNDGAMIGAHTIAMPEVIPPERVHDELLAVDNDGTFFDIDTPGTAQDNTSDP